ncbi:MAG: tyrosine-type recombinase/integrase [Desulfobulbus sp.]|nr:tyrosine-type recombinase/integrase [Desulfobulbus sp.]
MRQPSEQAAALPKAPTIKAIWPEYERHCQMVMSPLTVKDLRSCWRNHLSGFFGGLQPKMLNRKLIEQYQERRLSMEKNGREGMNPVKPRTVAKELHYFSGMLNWAVEVDLCDPLPFKIPRFPSKLTRAPKARPLTVEQIDALLAQIIPRHRLSFLLMADAGLRASEALNLRRCDVEYERGLIIVKGKGSKERIVPITTERLGIELATRRELSPADFLSANPKTGKPYHSLKKELDQAAKKAGINKHVHQHLLRHSFGTNATIAGVSQTALQDILGHSSAATTRIYQNYAAEYLVGQSKKFSALIASSAVHMGVGNTNSNTKK